jgi:O-methyltransferase involved in polyketide biosynthesis
MKSAQAIIVEQINDCIRIENPTAVFTVGYLSDFSESDIRELVAFVDKKFPNREWYFFHDTEYHQERDKGDRLAFRFQYPYTYKYKQG